jgi:hypothetical protein
MAEHISIGERCLGCEGAIFFLENDLLMIIYKNMSKEKEINRNDQTMVDACRRLEYGYNIIVACHLFFL